MELSSEYRLAANNEAVWWVLTNPTMLKAELPGLTKFEEESPGHYVGEVKVGVGFFKVTFSGVLVISDQEPPNRYRVRINGNGRGGSLDGNGIVSLNPVTDEETLVSVTGSAQVSGLIGRAGDRAINSAAQKILGEFFKKVETHARSRTGAGETR